EGSQIPKQDEPRRWNGWLVQSVTSETWGFLQFKDSRYRPQMFFLAQRNLANLVGAGIYLQSCWRYHIAVFFVGHGSGYFYSPRTLDGFRKFHTALLLYIEVVSLMTQHHLSILQYRTPRLVSREVVGFFEIGTVTYAYYAGR